MKAVEEHDMKLRITVAMLIALVLCFGFISCGDDSTPSGDTAGRDEEYVFNKNVAPMLIFAEDVTKEASGLVYQTVKSVTGSVPEYDDDSSECLGHEIVIGNTGRPISVKAMRKLRAVQRNSGYELAYLVYASGNSVALVYDDDIENLALRYAVEYFVENYLAGRSELRLDSGVLYSDTVSISEHYEAIDAVEIEARWSAFEAVAGVDITAAMRDLYSIYDPGMVTWIANLYDPYIGGFYYSNSARDNVGYLPDAESTMQALNTLSSSGLAYLRGGHWKDIIPDGMKEEIGLFIKSLQKPDGKFYHPQWADEYAKGGYDSRIGRDLSWCTSILNSLGIAPTYSVLNYTGDGVIVPPKGLTSSVGESRAQLVSRVTRTASHAAHLENDKTFRDYLAKLLPGDAKPGVGSASGFYGAGNTLTSQMSQIVSRDYELGVSGADYSLVEILIEWLNTYQNRETGVWAPSNASYAGTNGLLKIYGIYSGAGVAMPYADRAAMFAVDALSSTETVKWCVDIYNIWFSIGGVLANISNYGKDATVGGVMMTPAEQVTAIRAELRKVAPDTIRYTAERISTFKRADGSFSYNPKNSNATSQGMPTAVSGSVEGDVNGNNICSSGLVSYIYSALGYSSSFVPIYGEAELASFLRIVDKLGPVQKITADDNTVYDAPFTFDDDTLDEAPSGIMGGNAAGCNAIVTDDPRGSKEGNVILVTSEAKSSGQIVIPNNSAASMTACHVFEGEMCVTPDGTDKGGKYFMQITAGASFMIAVRTDGKKVLFSESTTNSNGTSLYRDIYAAEYGEWFSFRVEYYVGDKDTVRIKYFINGKITAVTDAYYGKTASGTATPATSSVSRVSCYFMLDPNVAVYFDDLYVYSSNRAYTAESTSDLIFNVDAQ